MADPKTKNGHIDIANTVADKLCTYRLNGQEWQILWVILRKTWGWLTNPKDKNSPKKKMDRIALSQFAKLTGINRSRCHAILKGLLNKRIIKKTVTQKCNTSLISYGIQSDFDLWQVLPKSATPVTQKCNTSGATAYNEGKNDENVQNGGVTQKCNGVLPKSATDVLPKSATTKDTRTKDTITKEKEHIVEQFKKEQIPYQKIVEHLNQKANKHFKYTSKETRNFIKARWNQGFDLNAFKFVIDIKCKKWLTEPKMIDYLRPQTLFGTKFESYLNETKHPLQGKVSDKTIQSIEALNQWEREELENEKQG